MQKSFWLSLERQEGEEDEIESKRMVFTFSKETPVPIQDLINILIREPITNLLNKVIEFEKGLESTDQIVIDVVQEIINAVRSQNWLARFIAFPVLNENQQNETLSVYDPIFELNENLEIPLEEIVRDIIAYLNLANSFLLYASQRDFSQNLKSQKLCADLLENIALQFLRFCSNISALELFYRKVDHCTVLGDKKLKKSFFNLTKGIQNNIQQGIVYKNGNDHPDLNDFLFGRGLYAFFVKKLIQKIDSILTILNLDSSKVYCDTLAHSSTEWNKVKENSSQSDEFIAKCEEERILYLEDITRSLGNTLLSAYNLSLFVHYFKNKKTLFTLNPKQRDQIRVVLENLANFIPAFLINIQFFSKLSIAEKDVIILKIDEVIINKNSFIQANLKGKKNKKSDEIFMIPQFSHLSSNEFESALLKIISFKIQKVYPLLKKHLKPEIASQIELLLLYSKNSQVHTQVE